MHLTQNRQGYESGRHTLLNDNSSERYCQPGEEYAILIHGWKETCETEWISLLASSMPISLSYHLHITKRHNIVFVCPPLQI